MDLGIPNFIKDLDLVNMLGFFAEKLPDSVKGMYAGLTSFVGGNDIAAILILGLAFYVIVDIIFHKAIDNPLRLLGFVISSKLISVVLFVLVMASVFVITQAMG